FLFLLRRPPPISTFFPYTTLFRSSFGQPLSAASIVAISILRIGIIASKARFDTAGSGLLIASSSTRGVICHENPHLSLHHPQALDRKSTRLNSSHVKISYAVFCLK